MLLQSSNIRTEKKMTKNVFVDLTAWNHFTEIMFNDNKVEQNICTFSLHLDVTVKSCCILQCFDAVAEDEQQEGNMIHKIYKWLVK